MSEKAVLLTPMTHILPRRCDMSAKAVLVPPMTHILPRRCDMSAKAIREATGKRLLGAALGAVAAAPRFAAVTHETDWHSLALDHPWLNSEVTVFMCGRGNTAPLQYTL